MTRMMHMDKKYRIHMKKNLVESFYIDVQAKNADEAEDMALRLIDNRLMHGNQTITASAYAEYDIENIEEL